MKNHIKDSTIASAFLLATSSAWASPKMGLGQPPSSENTEPPEPPKETRSSKPTVGGGKSQLGAFQRQKFSIESITLDKVNQRKITTCRVPTTIRPKKPRPKIKDVLSLSYNPNRKQLVTFEFEMSNMPTGKEERVLVLLYSRCLTKRPKIKTQFSKKKLALDTNDIEIMGTYDIPANPSDTTKDKSSATTSMTIEVELETDKLTPQIKAGNDTFYFQAAMLKKNDFDRKYYGTMTLSPLKAIHLTPKACPRKKQFSSDLNSNNESCKQLPTKTD